MIVTAWQNSLDETIAPAVLVTFGKVRRSLSVAILESDAGFTVEARCGRKLVERIRVGHNRDGLAGAIESAMGAASAAMLESL